ncbi:hypothetical protein DAMA08_012220 [Martiniozyma asiatica (nom. inval.)]|nr:hypothetical protein DAMA08_012220 [Martiniozyma asiatica]
MHFLCISYALSNYIANGIYEKDLFEKYDLFYLFTYKIPKPKFLIQLFSDFPHLRYNIAVILCFKPDDDLYKTLDLDIYSIAEFYDNKIILDDMLNKNKEKNIWYRHLDLKNCENVDPQEVTLEDKVNYGNLSFTSRFT